jgi:hypothetical protein
MFENKDYKYLKRLIGRNEVVLFLGSGFSRDAKNRNKEDFPTGWVLGQKIWGFLGYAGAYDGTSLPEMYQAFLNAGIKKSLKNEFLESNLLSDYIPEVYNSIARPYWYKIYSLNIDDVLSRVFLRSGRMVQDLIYPKDEYKERDQSLDKTNVIYLHGKLPCDPKDVIFSVKQYAKSQLSHQPLYGQFVFDYATRPTIFIGTDLNEPIFERYLEAREGKSGYAELRPKSFIITPNLSPVKADNLKNLYNVHHVRGTTDDFLSWLASINDDLPEKTEVLKITFPNLLQVLQFADISSVAAKSVTEFASTFNRIPREFSIKEERSAFLLGASPRWNDINRELDIPRTITNEVINYIEATLSHGATSGKLDVISLVGTAGSGKSTLLKRLGLRLSQNGRTAFLSYSDVIPRTDYITDVLRVINDRTILLFDNAINALPQLPSLIKALVVLKHPPVIILALRSNHSDKLNYSIDPEIVEHQKYHVPNGCDSKLRGEAVVLLAEQISDEVKLLTFIGGPEQDHSVASPF